MGIDYLIIILVQNHGYPGRKHCHATFDLPVKRHLMAFHRQANSGLLCDAYWVICMHSYLFWDVVNFCSAFQDFSYFIDICGCKLDSIFCQLSYSPCYVLNILLIYNFLKVFHHKNLIRSYYLHMFVYFEAYTTYFVHKSLTEPSTLMSNNQIIVEMIICYVLLL